MDALGGGVDDATELVDLAAFTDYTAAADTTNGQALHADDGTEGAQ